MWGTDLTTTVTTGEGTATVFVAVDHCSSECHRHSCSGHRRPFRGPGADPPGSPRTLRRRRQGYRRGAAAAPRSWLCVHVRPLPETDRLPGSIAVDWKETLNEKRRSGSEFLRERGVARPTRNDKVVSRRDKRLRRLSPTTSSPSFDPRSLRSPCPVPLRLRAPVPLHRSTNRGGRRRCPSPRVLLVREACCRRPISPA